ncbi:response regulator [Mesorhizobium sp. M1409]|uniref:response regulator transcription factor n=1 Tax=unclassified Mesorhizobium TaxID=325217 RepID=UPI0033399E8E
MSGGKRSVAIVDDDEGLLEATSGFLESMGYRAIPFSSGREFLDSGLVEEVSVLLTDVNMPGITGLELQKIVRTLRPAITIVMMTALQDENIRRKAMAGGARELLHKPVLADALIRCLEDAYGGPET